MPVDDEIVSALSGISLRLFGVAGWNSDAREAGLSSVDLMRFLVHVERHFGISIPDTELRPENLRSLSAVRDIVVRIRAASIHGSDGEATSSATGILEVLSGMTAVAIPSVDRNEDVFARYGLNSAETLQALILLEKRFGIILGETPLELEQIRNFGSLTDLVESKVSRDASIR